MKSSLSEFEYAIYPSRLCLSAVGIWPNLYDSRSFAIWSNIKFLYWWTELFCFLIIPQTRKLLVVGSDLDAIINILCLVDLPALAVFLKTGILRYYSRVVKWQLKSMIMDWMSPYSTEHTTTLHESALTGRWISLGCIATGYLTTNVYIVIQTIIQLDKMGTGIRPMFFESHFPVNVSGSPWFEITWCMQALIALHAITANSGIDGFFAVLALHLCGQLTMLEDQLIKLPEESNETVIAARIKRIVTRHNQLNKFAATIETTFYLMLLVQMTVCAIQFCLQVYQFISISKDSTAHYPRLQQIFIITYLVYIMFDLFVYCFVSEILRAKSLSISHAVFNSDWYELRPNEVHDLIMIANRAQYPLEITAGKFCVLSLGLFAAICKTSFGYLSMLLSVRERTSAA